MIKTFVKQHTTKGVRIALLKLRDELKIQREHRLGLKEAKRYVGRTDLKLHIGCGPNKRVGWVNVDLGGAADVQLDIREGLPFPKDSVLIVYSEHFFEHLQYTSTVYDTGAVDGVEADYPSEAFHFLRESFRVLRRGGVFSVGVPDAGEVLKAYAVNDPEPFMRAKRDVHPKWCRTPMDHINYTFRQGEQHKYAYDAETLAQILHDVGFVEIRRRDFDPELDTEKRRLGTLYMDSKRP